MNILLTGFCGTSSELLIKTAKYKSLILSNDKIVDSQMLIQEISRNSSYDKILSFGQKPNIKDKVYLETTAKNADSYINTNFEYGRLKALLETNNIPVQISNNAGTSFCNALYWNGLNYIRHKGLYTELLFLHIPFYKNISNPEVFFERILTAIEDI